MRSSLSRYIVIAKRWAWLVILGVVLCAGVTFAVSKLLPSVYQAKASLILTLPNTQSQTDMVTASLQLQSTYSTLITNPNVLGPVASNHGLSTSDLNSMITVTPKSNTQLIDISVQNHDPALATQLANEVATSFSNYAATQIPGQASIQVIPAIQPISPIRPNPTSDAMIGALVGLGLALALIIIFEWIDDRLGSPEEVRTLLNLEPLTNIPELSRKQKTQNAEETPGLAEGCRILCASMNMAQAAHPFKLVMVTSAVAGEGKSTIAANVASFLAMSGKRVLLVDADLRNPVLDQHFQLNNRKGLSNAFMEMWGQQQLEMESQPTELPSLRVLTAGVLPSNPSELLQSHLAQQLFMHFRNTQQFDYIIFDTPPVLPVADAQILGSYIQATILVADASKTPRKVLKHAKQILGRTGTRVLGVAINKSQWPEYGELKDYLVTMGQRPRADIAVNMAPQQQNSSMPGINPGMMRSPNAR